MNDGRLWHDSLKCPECGSRLTSAEGPVFSTYRCRYCGGSGWALNRRPAPEPANYDKVIEALIERGRVE